MSNLDPKYGFLFIKQSESVFLPEIASIIKDLPDYSPIKLAYIVSKFQVLKLEEKKR